MKYLAILKDSLREAIDAKVFYVMVGLSCLVLLVIAGIGFQPEPADDGLYRIIASFVGATSPDFRNPEPPVFYSVEDFHPATEGVRPWEADYHFVLTARDAVKAPGAFRFLVFLTSPDSDEVEAGSPDQEFTRRLIRLKSEAQAQGVPREKVSEFLTGRLIEELQRLPASRMERFVRDQLAAHGSLEATRVQVQSAKPTEVRFAVDAHAKPGTYRSWPHKLSFFFGSVPTQWDLAIGRAVYSIDNLLFGFVGAAITLLVSTIITAFFIPSMLRKGTVDLLLAKPIHRSTLLFYKFIGGLSFMFLNTAFIVVGVWLILGLRTGLWANSLFLVILILTFEFALFYAVSTLFGVLTRNVIVAILAACCCWVVLFAVGILYNAVEVYRGSDVVPQWLSTTADTAHFVLPRYKDLDTTIEHLLAADLLGADSPDRKLIDRVYNATTPAATFGFSAAFIALMLGLACLRFATKDY